MADEKKKPDATPAPEGAKEAPADAKKGEGKEAAPAAGAAAVKAPTPASPWLPVLAVMIILPILSLVMTESVIIPRVKKTLGDITAIQEASARPEVAGAVAGHGEKAAKSKEKAKPAAAHGGGHGAAPAANTAKDTLFENVVANLSGAMKSRFVKVSFTVEGDEEEFATTIKDNRTKIIDSTLGVLGALSVTDLDDPGMKNIVRSDLIAAINQALGETVVKRLFFSEFVIQ